MPNDATGYSPAMMLYGYEIRAQATWPAPREDFLQGDFQAAVENRIKVIRHLNDQHRATATEKTARKQQQRKKRYDAKVTPVRFKLSDKVLCSTSTKRENLTTSGCGPYVVVQVNQKGTYWLERPNGRRLNGAISGDMLTPWNDRTQMVPRWALT